MFNTQTELVVGYSYVEIDERVHHICSTTTVYVTTFSTSLKGYFLAR